ncbi:MAG: hypothetical protein AB7S38_28670 [Vulcanimicrobiota bacterium]
MSDTIECPFCAEEIKAAAVKCKHCGEFLSHERPVVSAEQSPIGEGSSDKQAEQAQLLGVLLWIGVSVFLYGTYTCFGVNETVAVVGNSAMLNAMNDRGLMWMGIGLAIIGLGWFARNGGDMEAVRRFLASESKQSDPGAAKKQVEWFGLSIVIILGLALWFWFNFIL